MRVCVWQELGISACTLTTDQAIDDNNNIQKKSHVHINKKITSMNAYVYFMMCFDFCYFVTYFICVLIVFNVKTIHTIGPRG